MEDTVKEILRKGLTSLPKYLPTWYNYDEIGSELEDKCSMANTGYYLRRSQTAILQKYINEMIVEVPYNFALVELGSGNCSKTKYFFHELLKRQEQVKFFPIDISEEFLMKTTERLSKEYGDKLSISPIPADYENGIEKLRHIEGAKLLLWFGSIINLSYEDQVEKLRLISSIMTDKCYLIFSADITLGREAVMEAYDDEAGLERGFFLNTVRRLNRDEGCEIELDKFHYKTDFVVDTSPEHMSYFLAFIQAKEDLVYSIPGLHMDLKIKKDERIYLHEGAGLSCKYTKEQIQNLTKRAGLQLTDTWTDESMHAIFCRCKVLNN